MTDGTTTAVIAASAAILGGLLAAFATRSVERMRLRAALLEKAEVRKLEAIEAFLLAVNAWLDWLIYMAEQPSAEHFDELNRRVKNRDDTYRRLLLLSSDRLYGWLEGTYNPAEYELKRTYGHQVRWRGVPDESAQAVRRRFSQLVRTELMEMLRPEVAALREPNRTRPRAPEQFKRSPEPLSTDGVGQ